MRASFTAESANEVSAQKGEVIIVKRKQPLMDIAGGHARGWHCQS